MADHLSTIPPKLLERTDPQDEPRRPTAAPDLNSKEFWKDFMLRTRRYHYLTRGAKPASYARGLDSNPEDMA